MAAILVFTGYKLVNPPAIMKLWKSDRPEFLVSQMPVIAIVATDLLTGVLIGFGLALAKLLYTFLHLEIVVQEAEHDKSVDVAFRGAATFVHLPRIAEKLDAIDDEVEVHFHLGSLAYADHAIMELFDEWSHRRVGEVVTEWNDFKARATAGLEAAGGIHEANGQSHRRRHGLHRHAHPVRRLVSQQREKKRQGDRIRLSPDGHTTPGGLASRPAPPRQIDQVARM